MDPAVRFPRHATTADAARGLADLARALLDGAVALDLDGQQHVIRPGDWVRLRVTGSDAPQAGRLAVEILWGAAD